MKILIIGGSGTIGRVIAKYLKKRHEVIVYSRSSISHSADIEDKESIIKLLNKTGKVDALICLAGEAKWDSFDNLTETDFYIGIKSKLMGQVNLVKQAMPFIKSNGSITLSTGILADHPVALTTSAAMVNGALHSFVKAWKMDENQYECRLNVVSLGLVEDAYDKYKDYFTGHVPITMEKAIQAYREVLEGDQNGEVVKVYS